MKNDPYSPDALDKSNPLVAGLDLNAYKIVNHEYQRMISRYQRAVEELDLMFLKLKQNLDRTCNHTVIQSIRSRVKSADSMAEKIVRLGKPCTLPAIEENLYDIAGLRLICSYVEDIYAVVRWLKAEPELKILDIKDYIKNPKPSGYRSLHVIFSFKVFDNHSVHTVNCEVQLRTAAMDAWAALEHQLQYKTGNKVDPSIALDLHNCAEMLNQTDLKMQEIYRRLRNSA